MSSESRQLALAWLDRPVSQQAGAEWTTPGPSAGRGALAEVRGLVEVAQNPAALGEAHEARDRGVVHLEEREWPAARHLAADLGDHAAVQHSGGSSARPGRVRDLAEPLPDASAERVHALRA